MKLGGRKVMNTEYWHGKFPANVHLIKLGNERIIL
jgi:hypothetical protein